jgi:hypothetical protein
VQENRTYHVAEGNREHTISPVALLRAARGFSCLFWGIPLGLLLFSSRTVGFGGAISIRAFSAIRLPTYILAVVVMYIGVIYLSRAGNLTRSWARYARKALFLLFLLMYFAPFFHWWDRMPHETFFTVNVLAFVFCTVWVLYVLNQLAGLAGVALDDDTFYIEAKLCGWSVVLLMLLPFAGIVIYALQASLRFKSSLYTEFSQVYRDLPPWMFPLFLLPFTLTMASTWKAKETCLRGLRRLTATAADASHGAEKRPPVVTPVATEQPVGQTAD